MSNLFQTTQRGVRDPKKTQILSVLTSRRDEVSIRMFLATSRLIAALGRRDAKRLLAYMTPFHRTEIVPFLRTGKRWSVNFNQVMYVEWMGYRRNNSAMTINNQTSGTLLYNLACFEMCWRIETLIWESRLMCLRGLSPEKRDDIYWDVLQILEFRWLASHRYASHELNVPRQDRALYAHLEEVLAEKYAQGCLPSKEMIAQLAADVPARRTDKWTPLRPAPCVDGCQCEILKRAAHLRSRPEDVPVVVEQFPDWETTPDVLIEARVREEGWVEL